MRLLGQGLGERREARGVGEDHAGLEEGLDVAEAVCGMVILLLLYYMIIYMGILSGMGLLYNHIITILL